MATSQPCGWHGAAAVRAAGTNPGHRVFVWTTGCLCERCPQGCSAAPPFFSGQSPRSASQRHVQCMKRAGARPGISAPRAGGQRSGCHGPSIPKRPPDVRWPQPVAAGARNGPPAARNRPPRRPCSSQTAGQLPPTVSGRAGGIAAPGPTTCRRHACPPAGSAQKPARGPFSVPRTGVPCYSLKAFINS